MTMPSPADPTPSVAPAPASTPTPSPIADLSYRSYTGPLHARTLRWWVVSLAGLRIAFRKPLFWVFVTLGALPYVFTAFLLYITSLSSGAQGMNPSQMFNPGAGPEPVNYAVRFFETLNNERFFLFLITLFVGSGAIASDLRANALQVYLSRPITKGDYLLGKWVGVFLPVWLAALLPITALYVFCLLAFNDQNFFGADRTLWLRLVGATMMPALLFSTVMLGFSAWSKTAFMAGAIFAAFHFLTGILAGLLWMFNYGIPSHFDLSRGNLVRHLSMEGVAMGLAQNVMNVTLKISRIRPREGFHVNVTHVPPPPFWILALIAAGLCALALLAARSKVKAVEVVRG